MKRLLLLVALLAFGSVPQPAMRKKSKFPVRLVEGLCESL